MIKGILALILGSFLGTFGIMIFQDAGGYEQIWQILDSILQGVKMIIPALEFIVGIALPIIFPIGQTITLFAEQLLTVLPQNALVYQITGIAIIIIGAIVNLMKPERVERI